MMRRTGVRRRIEDYTHGVFPNDPNPHPAPPPPLDPVMSSSIPNRMGGGLIGGNPRTWGHHTMDTSTMEAVKAAKNKVSGSKRRRADDDMEISRRPSGRGRRPPPPSYEDADDQPDELNNTFPHHKGASHVSDIIGLVGKGSTFIDDIKGTWDKLGKGVSDIKQGKMPGMEMLQLIPQITKLVRRGKGLFDDIAGINFNDLLNNTLEGNLINMGDDEDAPEERPAKRRNEASRVRDRNSRANTVPRNVMDDEGDY